jgi:hypothetical protein
MHLVTHNFSAQLLASIPKKIIFLLSHAGIDLSESHVSHDWLHISENGGRISILDTEIRWTGLPVEAREIIVSDERLLDLTKNLDYFVQLEMATYDKVERLIESARN